MSSKPQDRIRTHPETRFEGSAHCIDLRAAIKKLLDEAQAAQRGHRQQTLYKSGPMTLAIFAFEKGSKLVDHVADGVVVIQVIEGELVVSTPERRHKLAAGKLLVLAPGVKHSVNAARAGQMLLTVHMTEAWKNSRVANG